MMRALWSAATGMLAKQLDMDVIANNLANLNSAGFKKSRVDFQDLMYQTIRSAGSTVAQGSRVPTGIQVGLGTRAAAIQKVFSQGDFIQTENPLDLVIEGDGFFQVLLPDGSTAYTRTGAFKVDSEGRVVTSDGFVMEPELIVPATAIDISIGTDGTVTVQTAGENTPTELGQIQLARFLNPGGLTSIGRNLYKPTAASGDPAVGTPGLEGIGTIAQKFLEMSNVKVVEEMVNMIIAQRAYEVNSKAIQTSDEMLAVANNLRR
ncbi:MAG TPA: flagellar basal-body rod protein FlgG [Firmicutes bacterium]|jgi:flagellar basal-body rod protein FlgG|nr:flagellar basal-body rod protein FlgG [Bacillota bacterium]HBK61322.1 flagellar basal-body rod protein FlgG [Bacillota bacterium]